MKNVITHTFIRPSGSDCSRQISNLKNDNTIDSNNNNDDNNNNNSEHINSLISRAKARTDKFRTLQTNQDSLEVPQCINKDNVNPQAGIACW